MNRTSRGRVARWPLGVAVCIALVPVGCWWQRDAYTDGTARSPGMVRSMKTWEKRQQLDRLLEARWDCPVGDFPMAIRPPKPLRPVQLPENMAALAEAPPKVLGLFQGGDPMLEVVLIGSSGPEPFTDFQRDALAKLAALQKAPTDPLQKQENQAISSLFYGLTTFELYSGQSQRTVAAAAGAPGNPALYDWFVYCFEEPPTQKVMVAFLIPDAKYAEHRDAMVASVETLALGSKLSAAQAGALVLPAAAPAK